MTYTCLTRTDDRDHVGLLLRNIILWGKLIIILKHQAEDTRPNNLRMRMHSKTKDQI
jgi:hypothetical protein